MHRSIGNIIADTLELSLGYSERLLSGISPERFSRFADVGGVIIHSNHPCFIYGHLSLYAPRVTEQLGRKIRFASTIRRAIIIPRSWR